MQAIGAHTQNSSLSSAVTITVPAQAGHVILQALTQNVRVTIDGTAPTTSKGFQIATDKGVYLVPVPSNGELKVIEETASASIEYQFVQL